MKNKNNLTIQQHNTKEAELIYERFVNYEFNEINDRLKITIIQAINEALNTTMTKQKTLSDLVNYLETKIIGLKYLELQHKNKKPCELWELNTEGNSRFIEEYTFLLSFIKQLPEADKINSEELRKEALKSELENKKAIENELKKYKQ